MDRPQDGREGQVASQENVGAEDQPVEAGNVPGSDVEGCSNDAVDRVFPIREFQIKSFC